MNVSVQNNLDIEGALRQGLELYKDHIYSPENESKAIQLVVDAMFGEMGNRGDYLTRMLDLEVQGVVKAGGAHELARHYHRLTTNDIMEGYYGGSFFGLVRYIKSYCLRSREGVIMEAPHEVLWRTCCHLLDDPDEQVQAFNLMWREKAFTVATPMLMQAMTCQNNNASCFLLMNKEDSLEGIFETLADGSQISKSGGGIGVALSNVRSKGSVIKGTNGVSNGIIPLLQVWQSTSRYVDQGGGKRKGAVSVYLEPWHPDFPDFLTVTRESCPQEHYCPDLFTAVYLNDEFMRRVEAKDTWYMFCPSKHPELLTLYGEAFSTRYNELVGTGVYDKALPATDLMQAIIESQVESGRPYLVNKDVVNSDTLEAKAFGTIKSSNLCAEITEYTDENTVAVCTLASVSLPFWATTSPASRDELADLVVKMLNASIRADHAVSKTHAHVLSRPIGVGWQGVADYFTLSRRSWSDPTALKTMGVLQEILTLHLMEASHNYALTAGVITSAFQKDPSLFPMGVRANSMVTACMPTKSTSHLLGLSEGIDPHRSLISRQNVGTMSVTRMPRSVSQYLHSIGKRDKAVVDAIIANNGSAQGLDVFTPQEQEVLKCAFEVGNRAIIDMAVARHPHVCQSQSMNLYYPDASSSRVYSSIMYAWKQRLKTLVYYSEVQNSSYGASVITKVESPSTPHEPSCSLDAPDCESCSA